MSPDANGEFTDPESVTADGPGSGVEEEAPVPSEAEDWGVEVGGVLEENPVPDVAGTEDEGLREQVLEQAVAERDEYLDALRRLQADFENFRKRTIRQQTDLLERASESLINRLLPVLDALDLALAHSADAEGGANGDAAALVQIASLLRGILEKEGLARIDDAQVPFDPTRHDAVSHVPREEGDEEVPGGTVDEVLRSGYEMKGRVLRPAMVKVRG